ncbi:MAG TPA: glycosyltransferase family 2 protein [Bryobacteraceae bacterium]|nr:glycosyltransferase family 2 protein [Bryobacteraceae bacterium]
MRLPRISIVTPSFNQGAFLEWTLRSVIEQQYPNLEYVAMDGGSTDGSAEILERYRRHFTHFESAKDKGHADAVRRGFERTSGEIMAYLNSDDLLAPGALEFVAGYFAAHPTVDCVYSHRVFIDQRNIVTGYWILPPHSNWTMRRWDYIPQETCFWRRSLYQAAGGIDASFTLFDYDLFVRFMERGRMARADRFLGAFRRHPQSITSRAGDVRQHPDSIRVRRDHGISLRHWHWIPERLLHDWIERRSRAARQPGIGQDFDEWWGGRLAAK